MIPKVIDESEDLPECVDADRLRIFWTAGCSFNGAPQGADMMEILATTDANLEGLVGAATSKQPAASSQTGVDFATELDLKLQAKTDPTTISSASVPESEPCKGTPSKDETQNSQGAAAPAGTRIAILTATTTTAPDSSAGDKKPAATIEAASAIGSYQLFGGSPTGTGTNVTGTSPSQNLKDSLTNKATPDATGSTSRSSRLALTFSSRKRGSLGAAGRDIAGPNALAAVSQGHLDRQSQGSASETLPLSSFMTTQPAQEDSSSGAGPTAESPHDEGTKAISEYKTTAPETDSALQQSRVVETITIEQTAPAYVAGSTSDPSNARNGIGPDGSTVGSRDMTPGTRASSFVAPRSGVQDLYSGLSFTGEASPVQGSKISPTSSKPKPGEGGSDLQPSRSAEIAEASRIESSDTAGPILEHPGTPDGQSSSHLDKTTQRVMVDPVVSILTKTAQAGLQDASRVMDAPVGSSSSTSSKTLRNTALEPLGPVQSETTQVGLQNPSGRWSALDASTPSRIGNTVPGTAFETPGTMQNRTTQVGLQGSSTELDPEAEPTVAHGQPAVSANQSSEATADKLPSQGTGGTSSLQSPLVPGQVMMPGQERTASEAGLGPAWEQIETASMNTVGNGLKAASGEMDAPTSQGVTKLDPKGPPPISKTAALAQADGGTGSLLGTPSTVNPDGQDPTQSDADDDSASSAHGSRQTAASATKKDGETSQDSSKAADGKGSLTRANADSTFASQLTFDPRGIRVVPLRRRPEGSRAEAKWRAQASPTHIKLISPRRYNLRASHNKWETPRCKSSCAPRGLVPLTCARSSEAVK